MDWGKPYERESMFTGIGSWFSPLWKGKDWLKVVSVHWGTSTRKWESFPFDVCIISGSIRSVTKNDYATRKLRNWVIWCLENKKRIVGICYGHQLIGEILGGKIVKNIHGPRVGNVGKIEIAPNLPDALGVMLRENWITSHTECLASLPSEVDILSRSEGYEVEAFSYQNRVYGFQFHPEMTSEILSFLWEPHLTRSWLAPYRADLDQKIRDTISPKNPDCFLDWIKRHEQ